ncbi:MAG: autotransporter assembly complex family protein [Amphiplicatus sp.]
MTGRRRRIQRRAWGLATAAWAIPALAFAQDYRVEFSGAPSGLGDSLKLVSTLSAGKRDYPTTAALRRAARADIEPLENALKAAGYYSGSVKVDVARAENGGKPKVTFVIEPGPKFAISDYRIAYADAGDETRPDSFAALNIETNGAADGASLQALQQKFLSALWDKGYPAAKIVGRRAEAHMEAGVATAAFTFESGPRASFGEIRVDGADETETDYITSLRTWTPGEPFERSKLVTYRDRLAETGIFGSIDVASGAPEDDGTAPVLVTLEERKRRTIGVGLSYSTSEGPGARLFFEYRNLFHRGERLNVEMEGSEVKQSLEADLTKPLPLFPGAVFGELNFINETTDAYDARTVEIAAGLSRKWLDDRLETRAGVGLETSSIKVSKLRTDASDERTYFLSLPLSATWDTEDSLLNPTKGVRATLSVTPYTGSDTFTQTEATIRTRINFGPDDILTAAFRGRLGGTIGSSLTNLPANKRYYAGGGASVRGYDYQSVGALDVEGSPIGGRSVIEGSFEGRVRVTQNIQLAAFLDAGAVSPNSFPDFAGDYLMGAGGGVRYFTPVGPIRVDVAVPLDKRDSDRGFQLYISLGQSF